MAYEPTVVTVTLVNGKWEVKGTTFIDGNINKPWPVDLKFNTENEALTWCEHHGWVIQ